MSDDARQLSFMVRGHRNARSPQPLAARHMWRLHREPACHSTDARLRRRWTPARRHVPKGTFNCRRLQPRLYHGASVVRMQKGIGLAVLLSLSAPPSYARQPPATCGTLPAAPRSGELRGAAAAPKTALSVSPSCESRAQELPVRCVILDFDSTISAPQFLERFGKWAIADKAEILECRCLSLISY